MFEYYSRVNAKDHRPVLMRYVHVLSCKNLIKALRYTGAASRPCHVFSRADVKRIKKKSAPAFRKMVERLLWPAYDTFTDHLKLGKAGREDRQCASDKCRAKLDALLRIRPLDKSHAARLVCRAFVPPVSGGDTPSEEWSKPYPEVSEALLLALQDGFVA